FTKRQRGREKQTNFLSVLLTVSLPLCEPFLRCHRPALPGQVGLLCALCDPFSLLASASTPRCRGRKSTPAKPRIKMWTTTGIGRSFAWLVNLYAGEICVC